MLLQYARIHLEYVKKVIKAQGYLEEVKITVQHIQTEKQWSIGKLYSLFRGDFPEVARRKQACNSQGALK